MTKEQLLLQLQGFEKTVTTMSPYTWTLDLMLCVNELHPLCYSTTITNTVTKLFLRLLLNDNAHKTLHEYIIEFIVFDNIIITDSKKQFLITILTIRRCTEMLNLINNIKIKRLLNEY